jgi:hypothetical protein
VPAHGTASATVTGDPNSAPYGATCGQVEATDGTGAVLGHSLIGLDREDERYNLTVKTADRAGAPVPGVAVLYRTGDDYPFPVQIPDSDSLTLRLPEGEYSVLMDADLPGAAGPDDMGLGVLSVRGLRPALVQTGAVPEKLANTLMTGAEAPSARRVTPDVAMNGDLYTSVLVGYSAGGTYSEGGYGGTSVAAPEFSAVQALAVEARKGSPLGFANPALYARAGSSAFHDVVDRAAAKDQPPLSAVADQGLGRRHAAGASGRLRRGHHAQRGQGLRRPRGSMGP